MNNLSNFKTLLAFNMRYYLIPRFSNKKDKKKYIITMCVLAAVLLIPVVSLLVGLYALIVTTQNVEATRDLLSSLFVISQIITLFFGISTYLQVMYFSNDRAILATLPVKTSDIFITKLLTATAMEMLTSLILVLPSTIVTAIALAQIGYSLPVWYYVLIPVAVITLPLLVILLISILSFPIMKLITFFKKHQTVGAIVVVFLIVGLLMAIYIPLYSNLPTADTNVDIDPETATEEDIPSALSPAMEGAGNMGRMAIHTRALAAAMFGENVGINLLIYLGITFGALAIGVALSLLLFKSTMQSLDEGGSNAKTNVVHEYTQSNVTKALVMREIKVVTKDIGKMINVLMSYVMGPAIVFIMLFIMQMNSKGAEGSEIDAISAFCKGFTAGYAIMMIGGSNVGVSAGISLEGKSFAIMKTLPISARDYIKTKLMVYDIGGAISSLLCMIIALFFASFNIVDIIGYILVVPLTIVSLNAFSLVRDLKKPKLEWNVIREVTKNNASTLIPLVATLPMMILSIVLPIVTSIFIPNAYLASAITWGCLLIAAVIYYFSLRFGVLNKVEKLFNEVEC